MRVIISPSVVVSVAALLLGWTVGGGPGVGDRLHAEEGGAAAAGRAAAGEPDPTRRYRLERIMETGRPATAEEAFAAAAAAGDAEAVTAFLDAGVDVDGAGARGPPPLSVAAAGGHLEVVERLLGAGAEVNAAEGPGALALAIMGGHAAVATQLLDAGADPDPNGPDLAAVAADRGLQDIAARLRTSPPGAAEDVEVARIREVQRRLAELGFDPGPADGIVGPRTRGAVRRFRAARALPPGAAISDDLLRALVDDAPQAVVSGAPSMPSAGAEPTACAEAVDGKVEWDYRGSTAWNPINVRRLCGGAAGSVEPARCFERVMHGGIDWGGGTRWDWENALDLCEGAADAAGRISCFEAGIASGLDWPEAIQSCDDRAG